MRHDFAPFGADVRRSELAGVKFRLKMCLLFVKADWAELAHTFGFPTCGDGLRPCFLCNCYAATLYPPSHATLATLPWIDNIEEDYYAACARCEIHVVVGRSGHEQIRRLLALLPTRGTIMLANVSEYRLLKGDRLEPPPCLPDTSMYDDISIFPGAQEYASFLCCHLAES